MSKGSKIKWRESDLKELRRLTKNYNAKVARQRDKLIEQDKRFRASYVPDKASVRELRKTITTRKEFNAELDRMRNYIDTGLSFKLDETTKKSLRATVRDFNSKIDRLNKSVKGGIAGLPEKISSKWILDNVTSKEGLVKELREFKEFLKPGAEELVALPDTNLNIKLTKWQKESMEKRLEAINAARKAELEAWKKTAVTVGGKPTGYTQGEVRMDKGDFHELGPMTLYSASSTYTDMKEKYRLMIREGQEGYWDARTKLARINYIEKMERVLGGHPIGEMILDKMKTVDLSQFRRTLKGEDDLFLLLYEIEKHPDNYDTLLEEIWGEWEPGKDMYEEYKKYEEKKKKKEG